jgi:hypothetical protein
VQDARAARQLNCDGLFNPFDGRFQHDHGWYADIANLKYWRLATTANPSQVRGCRCTAKQLRQLP